MILVRSDKLGVANANNAGLPFGVTRHQRLLYLSLLISTTRIDHTLQSYIALG